MRRCKADDLLVVGPSGTEFGQIHAVAVLLHDAALAQPCNKDTMQAANAFTHEGLHERLGAYLLGAGTCDYAKLSRVYDVRALGWTWASLKDDLGCNIVSQAQGFPAIGNDKVRLRLLTLCQDPRVTQHSVHETCMAIEEK